MPVSHKYKVIFVHIPKTGGTALEYHLGMHENLLKVGLETTATHNSNSSLFGNEVQHYTAVEIRNLLGSNIFDHYEKFSIIRNPYERFISEVSWSAGFSSWQSDSYLLHEEFSIQLLDIYDKYKKQRKSYKIRRNAKIPKKSIQIRIIA